jgi:aldose 1-epimerase
MRSGLLIAAILGLSVVCHSASAQDRKWKVDIEKKAFGKTKAGAAVDLYTLSNSNGMKVKIMTLGATITELWVPDRKGRLEDVVLGFDTLKGYEQKGNPYFGCIVGRYANRIAGGEFTLEGKKYELAKNNGKNHLHGGDKGFDKYVWEWDKQAKSDKGKGGMNFAEVTFKFTSPHMDEGYPGELKCSVTYTLNDNNELIIKYEATTDRATVVNLTNHSYFNLKGHSKGTIRDHVLTMFAKKYTPVDATAIPTGKIEDVAGTPFDFLKPKAIGERMAKIREGGYDHNYVIDGGGKGKLAPVAKVYDKGSGRLLLMFSTEPGVQFYTGNFLDGTLKGTKGGASYEKHSAFCLEAQKYPDTPNHKSFPSAVLKKGETYKQTTVYQFRVASD